MLSSYREFQLMLLRDCVYNHLHREIPILREIKLNGNFDIRSSENKYSEGFHVSLYKLKYEGLVILNPAQYILKVKINDSNRLYYEVFDQDELNRKRYFIMKPDEFERYKEECIRIVSDVNKLLDKIGDNNFPANWKEYKSL